jgi:hypothetical protein
MPGNGGVGGKIALVFKFLISIGRTQAKIKTSNSDYDGFGGKVEIGIATIPERYTVSEKFMLRQLKRKISKVGMNGIQLFLGDKRLTFLQPQKKLPEFLWCRIVNLIDFKYKLMEYALNFRGQISAIGAG